MKKKKSTILNLYNNLNLLLHFFFPYSCICSNQLIDYGIHTYIHIYIYIYHFNNIFFIYIKQYYNYVI